ncbi:BatD family protein [uncultured Microbulbifer sp.]|uniref:BatD family protein n=1 Tax=uncultured Microbulbifer sp. TaxID=348147 RepID=UPI0026037637|nr:BatD family protein [uncultured Microbulbifer sp.]
MESSQTTHPSRRSLPAGKSRTRAKTTPFTLTKFLILAPLLLLVSLTSNAKDLTASVDRNELAINETFTLTLRYGGGQRGGQPDFNLLEQDFEVLSRQQSNQYRVINGHAESFVEWTVILAPLKEGKLFVPSLHLHGQISDAIPITVNQAGQAPSSDSRKAFLEVELDKEKLHVQEQLLIKVRLYTTVGLHDIATDPLKIPGAHVEKVDEQRFERRIKGVGHAVYELTYAVFPESSGELQIPALNYVAVTGRRDPFSLFNRNAQRIRLRSEAKTVKVEPKPDSYSGSHWLPAAGLGLVQSWSKDPEEFRVGEPITRIITLRAEGLRAAQLPPLPKLNIEGLKTYPDQPQQEDQPGMNGITGSRIETTAIVATKPGSYQLPPVTITWWDTKTGRQRATQLPAFRFEVGGGTLIDSDAHVAPHQPSITAPDVKNVEPGFWQKLAIAAIASHLFWIIYLFYFQNNNEKTPKPAKSRPKNSAETENLKRLIQNESPQDIQVALQEWLGRYFPEVEKYNLTNAAQKLDIAELTHAVQVINDAIYQAPAKPINRQLLIILIDRIAKYNTSPAAQPRNLPQLFGEGST